MLDAEGARISRGGSSSKLVRGRALLLALAVVACSAIVAGCGGNAPPAKDPSSSSPEVDPAPVGDEAPAEAASEPGEAPADAPKKGRKLTVRTECDEVVEIAFERADGEGEAEKIGIGPGGEVEWQRPSRGDFRAKLRSSDGQVVADVRISRGMKELLVGKSCMTLNSH